MQCAIIIANHNYGHWIMDAIQSAINQNIELKLLVANDGCEDNSKDTVLSHCKIEKNITNGPINVYKGNLQGLPISLCDWPKSQGPSFARNFLIKNSKHKYYAVLDADDIFLPNKIKKSLEILEDSNVGAVYSNYETWNVHTNVRVPVIKEPFSRERLVQECIVHSACVISREALDLIGLYDEEMRTCEDYDLWMRISERFMISHIAEILMTVRVGDYNSTMAVQKEVWQKNWRRVMEKAQERLKPKI